MLLSVLLESIVTATVEVTVRVTSQNFSEKLNDQESKEFKDFNKTFSEQVTPGDHAAPSHPTNTTRRNLEGGVKMATELLNVCASQLARAGRRWEARPGSSKRVQNRSGLWRGNSLFDLRVASGWDEDWGVLISHSPKVGLPG